MPKLPRARLSSASRRPRVRGAGTPEARRSPGGSGQALAELALVTPILVLLIMAVVQIAFVLEAQMGLTNAAREAARRAAADPAPTITGVEGQLDMLLAANIQGFDAARVASRGAAFSEYCLVNQNNSRVTVTVTYGHPVFFPLLDFATDLVDGLDDGNWTLTATAQMRLETPRFPGSC